MAVVPELKLDDLVGHVAVVGADAEIVIGRSGTFVIGEDDQFMHRALAHIWFSGAYWVVKNIGYRIPLSIELLGDGVYHHIRLGSGSKAILQPGLWAIVCATTEREYELRATVRGPNGRGEPKLGDYADDPAAERVREFVPNVEQMVLLRALAAPLRNRPGWSLNDIPTVDQLHHTLGWSQKKVENKIAYLSRKLEEHGVPGFTAHNGKSLTRRLALAKFAIESM